MPPTKTAPKPDHVFVSFLLPSISTPKAVLDPEGHTLKKTAQSAIAKLLNLCSTANILYAVVSFGSPTTGVTAIAAAGFSSSKLRHVCSGTFEIGVSQDGRPPRPGPGSC